MPWLSGGFAQGGDWGEHGRQERLSQAGWATATERQWSRCPLAAVEIEDDVNNHNAEITELEYGDYEEFLGPLDGLVIQFTRPIVHTWLL